MESRLNPGSLEILIVLLFKLAIQLVKARGGICFYLPHTAHALGDIDSWKGEIEKSVVARR
jgi:hypothetical protein